MFPGEWLERLDVRRKHLFSSSRGCSWTEVPSASAVNKKAQHHTETACHLGGRSSLWAVAAGPGAERAEGRDLVLHVGEVRGSCFYIGFFFQRFLANISYLISVTYFSTAVISIKDTVCGPAGVAQWMQVHTLV